MTNDRPTQPTGCGEWIWHKPLTRVTVDMAQFAKHEARPIVQAPERDMAVTVEELDA